MKSTLNQWVEKHKRLFSSKRSSIRYLKMGKVCGVLLSGWSIVFCTNSAFASHRETLIDTFIETVSRATVFITAYDSLEKPFFGTGVLAYDYRSNSNTVGFLITNKHVFENKEIIKVEMPLFIPRYRGEFCQGKCYREEYLKDKKGNLLWETDDSDSLCDIAVIELRVPCYYEVSSDEKIDTSKVKCGNALPLSCFADDRDIYEGENVYIIGFPLGIHGDISLRPIVRQGIIASK